jgi:Protein of unknown function (DUF2726)
MPPLDTTTLAALTITALLMSWLWARRRGQGPRHERSDALDTIADFPPQAVRVLTLTERQAYDLLQRALPGHLVLAQVPLSRFISVPAVQMHGEWLNRVGRLSVDLLVCDKSSNVIAAIEIRTEQESARSQKRHARLVRVLQAARIPVQQWDAGALPSTAEVRSSFAALWSAKSTHAAPMSVQASAMLPVPDIMEVLELGDREFAIAEQLEPVPSGFFDDVEFGSTPTAKS